MQAIALQKFNLTCASINVEFQVVKDPALGAFVTDSVAVMVKKIEDKVKAGAMQVIMWPWTFKNPGRYKPFPYQNFLWMRQFLPTFGPFKTIFLQLSLLLFQ